MDLITDSVNFPSLSLVCGISYLPFESNLTPKKSAVHLQLTA